MMTSTQTKIKTLSLSLQFVYMGLLNEGGHTKKYLILFYFCTVTEEPGGISEAQSVLRKKVIESKGFCF